MQVSYTGNLEGLFDLEIGLTEAGFRLERIVETTTAPFVGPVKIHSVIRLEERTQMVIGESVDARVRTTVDIVKSRHGDAKLEVTD